MVGFPSEQLKIRWLGSCYCDVSSIMQKLFSMKVTHVCSKSFS